MGWNNNYKASKQALKILEGNAQKYGQTGWNSSKYLEHRLDGRKNIDLLNDSDNSNNIWKEDVKTAKARGHVWTYNLNYYNSGVNRLSEIQNKLKQVSQHAHDIVNGCEMVSPEGQDLMPGIKMSCYSIGIDCSKLNNGIQQYLYWCDNRKIRGEKMSSQSTQAVLGIEDVTKNTNSIGTGSNSGNSQFATNYNPEVNTTNENTNIKLNESEKVSVNDSKVTQKEIENEIDLLVKETKVSEKQKSQQEISKKFDELLKDTDIENKEEAKKKIENKVDQLIKETKVDEKKKIADEIKTEINSIVNQVQTDDISNVYNKIEAQIDRIIKKTRVEDKENEKKEFEKNIELLLKNIKIEDKEKTKDDFISKVEKALNETELDKREKSGKEIKANLKELIDTNIKNTKADIEEKEKSNTNTLNNKDLVESNQIKSKELKTEENQSDDEL